MGGRMVARIFISFVAGSKAKYLHICKITAVPAPIQTKVEKACSNPATGQVGS
jgi:hypothetical protein